MNRQKILSSFYENACSTNAWHANRVQYLVFAGLGLGACGFVAVLQLSDSSLFQRFLGRINPLIAFLCAIAVGFALLSWSLSQGWFVIYREGNRQGLLWASGLASVLGIIMILMDTRIVFPADTNILFPKSLLFYPAIGFFCEILFHVLPVVALLVVLSSIFKSARFEALVWVVVLIISAVEPVYHMMDMVSSNRFPSWAVVYVGFHVFLFNLIQLRIFKRYDFVSMYVFRLVYYLFWHIGWGYVRLRVLF